MGCWVLVVAARMVGCRLLGFGCGSYDDGCGGKVLVVAAMMMACGG